MKFKIHWEKNRYMIIARLNFYIHVMKKQTNLSDGRWCIYIYFFFLLFFGNLEVPFSKLIHFDDFDGIKACVCYQFNISQLSLVNRTTSTMKVNFYQIPFHLLFQMIFDFSNFIIILFACVVFALLLYHHFLWSELCG